MKHRVCKNKKCQRPLPEGYKHKYCESCRNNQVKMVRETGKKVLGFVVMLGGVAVTVGTKGRINPKK